MSTSTLLWLQKCVSTNTTEFTNYHDYHMAAFPHSAPPFRFHLFVVMACCEERVLPFRTNVALRLPSFVIHTWCVLSSPFLSYFYNRPLITIPYEYSYPLFSSYVSSYRHFFFSPRFITTLYQLFFPRFTLFSSVIFHIYYSIVSPTSVDAKRVCINISFMYNIHLFSSVIIFIFLLCLFFLH